MLRPRSIVRTAMRMGGFICLVQNAETSKRGEWVSVGRMRWREAGLLLVVVVGWNGGGCGDLQYSCR